MNGQMLLSTPETAMPFRASLLLAPAILLVLAGFTAAFAADLPALATARGDRMLADYFRAETAALAGRSLADIRTLDEWNARKDEYRRQLFEMLGLWPLPARAEMKPVVTGRVDHSEFTVENVQFQSMPGLYVTGNLYVPKALRKPAPAVLYVCGHGNNKKNGVSYGSKTFYQHHGGWLARSGYVCLTIDTLQLGEIEGLHHGTYREKMWWWNSRGYTPAGVEAWNSIRALDYLQSRPEVDRERLGVTGRSGGGAYSWYLAALDERIKAAVPVAGITDLQNHVVDGAVEGHCDCMFIVNTYRWDYAKLAALVAPRPLLIGNTDKDPIFPLDGVVRLHARVRRIYQLHKAEDRLGLLITEGPHKDTQDLQVPTLHWLNRFLKNEDPLVETVAAKLFAPEQLKVFKELPADQRNTRIHESFVPVPPPAAVPVSSEEWKRLREGWLGALREKSFRGWPEESAPLDVKQAFSVDRHGIRFSAYDFTSQDNVRLRLYLAHRSDLTRPDLVVLNALDDQGWKEWLAGMQPGFAEELRDETLPGPDENAFAETRKMFRSFKWGMAYVAPRGVGPTAWDQSERKQVQHRRRFMLLGQTLEGMQVWDVRRAAQALRTLKGVGEAPLWLQGEREMAGIALYTSLFEPGVARLDLWHLPKSHQQGPSLLNVLKILDVPQAVAMAAERSKVRIYQQDPAGWEYPAQVAQKLGWEADRLQVRKLPPQQAAK
jgi:dienelactone hydrolase